MLNGVRGQKKKEELVKLQLKFRRHVLGAKNTNSLFSFSAGGEAKTLTELTANLTQAIDN